MGILVQFIFNIFLLKTIHFFSLIFFHFFLFFFIIITPIIIIIISSHFNIFLLITAIQINILWEFILGFIIFIFIIIIIIIIIIIRVFIIFLIPHIFSFLLRIMI